MAVRSRTRTPARQGQQPLLRRVRDARGGRPARRARPRDDPSRAARCERGGPRQAPGAGGSGWGAGGIIPRLDPAGQDMAQPGPVAGERLDLEPVRPHQPAPRTEAEDDRPDRRVLLDHLGEPALAPGRADRQGPVQHEPRGGPAIGRPETAAAVRPYGRPTGEHDRWRFGGSVLADARPRSTLCSVISSSPASSSRGRLATFSSKAMPVVEPLAPEWRGPARPGASSRRCR